MKASSRRIVDAWWPVALYMALIFTLSSFALEAPLTANFPYRDKFIHFFEYGILGFLATRGTKRTWPQVPLHRVALFGALIAAVFGLTDEVHQAFVPGRSAEVLDLVADTLGASVGALLYGLRARHRRA